MVVDEEVMQIGQRLSVNVKVLLKMRNQQLDEILPTKMHLGICAQTQMNQVEEVVVGFANVSLHGKMMDHHLEHVKGMGLVNVRQNRMSQGDVKILKHGPRAVLRDTMNQ